MLRSQTPPTLLPTALACLLLLASCGGGSDDAPPTHASRYPALAAHADMDEEDFERLLLAAGRGTDITPETIKSLSVGSSINSAASTYNLRPIFDLGRLKEDGRLNVDTTRSQQVTALHITSNRKASTESSQFTLDTSLSGSLGHWKAAAAFHHAEARRNTQSDGTVNVQLVSANTNNLVSILGSGFGGSENFTGYLTGTKLTDELLRGYVSTTESTPTGICGGKPYTTSVAVSRYKLSDTEPYANIQILSRMESVFADLRAQYDLCADASIQTVLVRQMTELRGKIQSAIADFYAFNGDSFVSRTASMNQAVGNGQLTFNTSDGNAEAQNGASLSGKYQTPAGGAGGSTTLQFYKQNGWAKALQNVQVSAEAKPAGVADTTAWVSSIHTMLKDQGSSLVPPMGSLPKDPGVKLPDPVGPTRTRQTRRTWPSPPTTSGRSSRRTRKPPRTRRNWRARNSGSSRNPWSSTKTGCCSRPARPMPTSSSSPSWTRSRNAPRPPRHRRRPMTATWCASTRCTSAASRRCPTTPSSPSCAPTWTYPAWTKPSAASPT